MAISLPTLPRGCSPAFRLVELGGPMDSPLGGPTLWLSRLGDKLAVDVELPKLDKDQASAALWLSQRLKAKAEGSTVRLVVPQMGDGAAVTTCTATSGSGAGIVKTGGSGMLVGMLFSFTKSSRKNIHMVTGISGGNLTVAPPLRADPAGLVLDFAAPTIEGFLDGVAWTLDSLLFVGQSFSIIEDR
jgi:hypothetical protein